MRTIIVPTDFSDNSIKAFHYARQMFGNMACKFVLVHAWSVPSGKASMLMSLKRKIHDAAEQHMENLKDRIARESEGAALDLDWRIIEGGDVEVILGLGKELDAEMIVMGTQGASGLQGALIGSTASNVLAKSEIPVLAVPRNAEFTSEGSAVFAASGARDQHEPAFSTLIAFAGETGAPINVLHIVSADTDEDSAEIAAVRASYLDGTDNVTFHLRKNGNIVDGIFDFLEETDAHLLCMVTRKRGFFGRLFDPSMTRKAAMTAQCPLLVYQQ